MKITFPIKDNLLDPRTVKILSARVFASSQALITVLVAVSVITILSGKPFWMTNDNALMSWIASGLFTGEFSGRLVYVSQLLGWPIAYLYQFFPFVAWLPILIVASVILSFTFLSRLTLDRWTWIALYLTSIPVVIFVSLRPNFTVIAFLMTAVGFCLMVASSREGRIPILGITLVIFGSLWRFEASLLAMLALSPVAFFAGTSLALRTKVRIGSFSILAPLVALILNRMGKSCWGSEVCIQWSSFLEMNQITSSFLTRPRGAILAQFDGYGDWTSAQINLFMNYSFTDDPLFGLSRVTELHESFPLIFSLYGYDLPSHLVSLSTIMDPIKILGLGIIAAIAFPSLLLRRARPVLFMRFVILLATVTISGLLTSIVTFTFSNVVGLVLTFWVGLLTVSSWSALDDRKRAINYAAVGGITLSSAAILSSLLAGPMSPSSLNSYANDQWLRSDFFQSRLSDLTRDAIVFGQGNLADYFVANPFDRPDTDPHEGVLLSGWSVFSPEFEARKETLGFDNILMDLGRGLTSSGQRTFFIGSGTNAQLIADVINEQSVLPPVTPKNRGQLTMPGDTLIGDVFVWNFIPVQE